MDAAVAFSGIVLAIIVMICVTRWFAALLQDEVDESAYWENTNPIRWSLLDTENGNQIGWVCKRQGGYVWVIATAELVTLKRYGREMEMDEAKRALEKSVGLGHCPDRS